MIDISHARKDHVHTDLLDRVAGGDYEAFATLYFDLYRPVQRYAQMLLTDAADAQHVAAAVFVEIWHTARLRAAAGSTPTAGRDSQQHDAARQDPARQSVLRWALTITRRRCLKRPKAPIAYDKHLTCQLGILLAAAGARQSATCLCLES
jgi:hypothetical protein